MPFIRNVYLVVSHRSQVPQWADTSNLKIVLHEDIIPAEYLPTFNCNPIEMHLHRIEGLDEQYLYFNDDLYPLRECRPEDFFRDGKGVIRFSRQYLVWGMYKHICKNSDMAARKALGMKMSLAFVRPQHTCTPMLRSECERLYDILKDDILASLTRTRTKDNLNQYMFLDYQYYQGKMISERLSNKHISVAMVSAETLRKSVLYPTKDILCVNDVRLSDDKYEELRSTLLEAFELKFPEKSRFEL